MNIKSYNNKQLLWVERAISWGTPMCLVPTFRYIHDSDKPSNLRKELFVRDSISYVLGAATYFSITGLVDKAMTNGFKSKLLKPLGNIFKNASPLKKRFLPVISGGIGFALWSGFCGPEISRKLFKNSPHKRQADLHRTSVFGNSLRMRHNREYYGVPFLANQTPRKSIRV